MSSYEEVVSKDLELLWSIQEYCYRTPKLNTTMSKLVSRNPLRDIVIILWIFFIYGVIELGRKHFWVVSMNLAVAYTARNLIEAKRPVEYDVRLQPMTDTRAESYGFPSLESYMSVVIMGHLFFSFKSIWLLPIGLAVICVIGFSRVYSRSRFPHQIVGSWLFGLIGLLASMHCCEKMSFHTWGKHQHGTCVMVVLAAILCNFALSVEDNESRLFSVSKEEFLRVMSDLLSGTSSSSKGDGDQQQEQEGSSLVEVLDADALAAMSAAAADEGEFFDPTGQIPGSQRQLASYRSKTSSSGGRSSTTGRSSSEGAADTAAGTATSSSSSSSSSRMGESPRTLATKQAQINRLAAASNSDRLGSRKVRSDSLYFLQKSIEARENSYRLGTGITTGIAADQSDDDFQHLNAEAGFMRG